MKLTLMESDTVGGFNSMISEQKKEEGEVLSDTVTCVRKGKGISGAALDRVRKDCRKRGGGE